MYKKPDASQNTHPHTPFTHKPIPSLQALAPSLCLPLALQTTLLLLLACPQCLPCHRRVGWGIKMSVGVRAVLFIDAFFPISACATCMCTQTSHTHTHTLNKLTLTLHTHTHTRRCHPPFLSCPTQPPLLCHGVPTSRAEPAKSRW